MTTLRIEHPVPNFEAWKKAFDSDPIRREKLGVRRYRILRPAGDPHFVTVDLEFDDSKEAEAFRAALHELWRQVEGSVIQTTTSDSGDGREHGAFARSSMMEGAGRGPVRRGARR